MDILQKLNRIIQIKESEQLLNYSTFGIGGPAKYFCFIDDQKKLIKLLKIAARENLPYFILGGGSNLLINDQGFDGLVIKLSNKNFRVVDNIIYADAGLALSKLVGGALAASLSGLEWAAGIPGTVGGAVYGNAGAYGREIKDNIFKIKVIKNGKLKTLKVRNCDFSYRHSIFQQNQDVIWSIVLELDKGEVDNIKDKINNYLKLRKDKFIGGSNVGSIFKNIVLTGGRLEIKNLPDEFLAKKLLPAAWLIDNCGLKGRQVGGAKISEHHAGVILNVGGATTQDVIKLISIVKSKVWDKFGIVLEEEIKYLG